jgi:hypothetical protein
MSSERERLAAERTYAQVVGGLVGVEQKECLRLLNQEFMARSTDRRLSSEAGPTSLQPDGSSAPGSSSAAQPSTGR